MPTLILPARFQRAPYDGDYYKILGLDREPSPSREQIMAAYRAIIKMYHPDKISTSPVQPPLTIAEATECFRAIGEIKSIMLSNCVEVMVEPERDKASVPEDVKSADDLSPGEQLKAYILAYVRSARFCEYAEGTGPGVRGYWSYISPGANDTEIGTSKYSGHSAIATSKYQVEVTIVTMDDWKQPLTVYDKGTRPFTIISDPQKIRTVLETIAGSIPKASRDHCAKIYGNYVREKQAVTSVDHLSTMFKKSVDVRERTDASAAASGPFVIHDAEGNNFVDGIRKNSDDSFTIFGRNSRNQPRELTLYQDGRAVGYNPGAPLGVVESQFLANKANIFNHFGYDIDEEIPSLARNLRCF